MVTNIDHKVFRVDLPHHGTDRNQMEKLQYIPENIQWETVISNDT